MPIHVFGQGEALPAVVADVGMLDRFQAFPSVTSTNRILSIGLVFLALSSKYMHIPESALGFVGLAAVWTFHRRGGRDRTSACI